MECAAYIWNHIPTFVINGRKTPLRVWSGKKPDVSHLKVFGCMAYGHVPDAQRQKFGKKAMELGFVGYSTQSKCYRLLDEETSRIYVWKDVVFIEQDFVHGTKRDSRRSPPETVDVQPSCYDILKRQEQAKPL